MSLSHKAVVEGFLKASGIVPVSTGILAEDLSASNDLALEFISYAISSYSTLPGILGKVKVLAYVMNRGSDDQRIYQNTLTELMALKFVAETLNEPIVGLESTSPNGRDAKKCDLESEGVGASHFYEVKDLSSEVLSQEPAPSDHRFTFFDPAFPPKIKKWLEARIGDCLAKGANYLICRAPAWHVQDWPKLTTKWVSGLYPQSTQIGPKSFRIVHDVSIHSFFKGVYLLRRDEHLFMEF